MPRQKATAEEVEKRFADASSPAAAAKVTPGATVVDTPEGIERFRMISLLSGLKLETVGLRMSRGLSALAIARRDYGIVAPDALTAHERLRAKMLERGIITE